MVNVYGDTQMTETQHNPVQIASEAHLAALHAYLAAPRRTSESRAALAALEAARATYLRAVSAI